MGFCFPSKKNSAPRDIPDSPSTPEMERRIYKSQCPVISQAFRFFSLYTSKLQSRSCVRRYLDETPVQVLESVFWQTSDLISKSPTVNLTEVHSAFVSWAPIWKLYQSLLSGVTGSHDFHQLNLSWSHLTTGGNHRCPLSMPVLAIFCNVANTGVICFMRTLVNFMPFEQTVVPAMESNV